MPCEESYRETSLGKRVGSSSTHYCLNSTARGRDGANDTGSIPGHRFSRFVPPEGTLFFPSL